MGMFDSIMVPCPNCGRKVEFQTKAGACQMDVYSVEDAPAELAWDILNEPKFCRGCRRWFAVIDPAHPPGVQRPPPNARPALLKRQEETREMLSSGHYYWPYDRDFSFDDLDQPASVIEAATAGETGTGSTEGKSATAESRDAQPSPASTPTPEG